jgi:hypothetical protein
VSQPQNVKRARLWLAASIVAWVLSHVAIEVLPGKVFQHILLAISWLAIVMTIRSWITSEKVYAEEKS